MLNTYLQELLVYAKKTANGRLSVFVRDFLDNNWSLPKPGVMGRAVNAAHVSTFYLGG